MIKLNIQLFASNSNSKNLYSSAYPSKYPYLLSVSFTENKVTDTHIQNNKTSITVNGSLKAQGAYWSTSNESTLQLYWYDSKTKKETLKKSYSFKGLSGYNDSKSTSVTFDVEHNGDGTLSGYAKIKYLKGSTTSNYAPASNEVATSSTTLTTIPRATDCPNLDGYIESSAPISLNPAVDTFKHRLYYSYNGKTGYYPSSTGFFANTGSLNLDTSFYEKTPKSSGTGSLTLYTYSNDGTYIGEDTGTLTVRCDKDKCQPEIEARIFDAYIVTRELTGDENKLVKGFSYAIIEFNITPKNGSIISIQSVNGEEMYASPHSINTEITNKFQVIAIDSRGFETKKTINVDVIDYVPLRLNFNAFRPSPTESEIKVNFTGTYFNDTFGSVANTLELSWKYKEKGANEWITGGNFIKDTDYKIVDNTFYSGTGSSASDITLSTTLFPYNKAFDIGIFYKDKLIDSGTSKPVPKGEPVVNWSDGLFNVNGELKVFNNPIIEIGEDYIKYYDGTLIVNQRFKVNLSFETTWGSIYTTGDKSKEEIGVPDYPIPFVGKLPKISRTIEATGDTNAWECTTNQSPSTLTNSGSFQLARGTAISGSKEYTVNITAIGKWK